uniref:Uncharacterized protein n=1 Tax=Glossina pallidipes TaxID=7398 RepID=A0A1A9Z3H2_GLOPL
MLSVTRSFCYMHFEFLSSSSALTAVTAVVPVLIVRFQWYICSCLSLDKLALQFFMEENVIVNNSTIETLVISYPSLSGSEILTFRDALWDNIDEYFAQNEILTSFIT